MNNKLRGSLLTDTSAVGDTTGERFDELLRHGSTRIERIVSTGHSSPEGFYYEQDEPEWILVVSGRALLRLAEPDEVVELGPADWLYLPPRRKHRVEWTTPDGPTVWLAVWPGSDRGEMTGDG